MSFQHEELKRRTKEFAIRIVKLFRSLPKTEEARIIGRQVLRSGTSVAANYRSVCRARSRAEFIAKIGVVLEEADETQLWLELIIDAKLIPAKRVQPLVDEAGESIAIFVASSNSASLNLKSAI